MNPHGMTNRLLKRSVVLKRFLTADLIQSFPNYIETSRDITGEPEFPEHMSLLQEELQSLQLRINDIDEAEIKLQRRECTRDALNAEWRKCYSALDKLKPFLGEKCPLTVLSRSRYIRSIHTIQARIIMDFGPLPEHESSMDSRVR